jgi:hypothetical protein
LIMSSTLRIISAASVAESSTCAFTCAAKQRGWGHGHRAPNAHLKLESAARAFALWGTRGSVELCR